MYRNCVTQKEDRQYKDVLECSTTRSEKHYVEFICTVNCTHNLNSVGFKGFAMKWSATEVAGSF